MPAKIIDCKQIAEQIKQEIKDKVAEIKKTGDAPSLAVILVGNDPASEVYVGSKKKACEFTGITSYSYDLPAETTEAEILSLIDKLNADPKINGILVQMPVPKHIDPDKVFKAVSPEKDVDCFHPYNIGLLSMGRPNFLPATPAGAIEILKRSGAEISGKNCVVLGRSNIVGKPMAQLLMQEDGTVTVCHSKTKNLAEVCREADILVAAIGKPQFVTKDMVKEGAFIVDVGINRKPDSKKLLGDVDFDGCAEVAGSITPVPGGAGVMTIAMLMQNCLTAYLTKKANG